MEGREREEKRVEAREAEQRGEMEEEEGKKK